MTPKFVPKLNVRGADVAIKNILQLVLLPNRFLDVNERLKGVFIQLLGSFKHGALNEEIILLVTF